MIDWILRVFERRRRRKAALAYNRNNTFLRRGSWMCPSCCAIHRARPATPGSGPQFSPCCEFPAGGRLGKRFATLT